MLGLEVEGIDHPAEKFQHFVVGYVLEREKHPNADKLSVCTVQVAPDVTNTIVCGAPNVAAGQNVAVALEGAIVPNGGFAIAKRKLRGVESNGMICSRAELGLGEESDGIWVLPTDAPPPGTPLADYIGMNDVLYDISITPNRADCLSHLGIAREIAAYFNAPLRKPVMVFSEDETKTNEHVTVIIDDPDVCWRFAARVVRGVKIQESPAWLKNRLIACGLRPINNVVDVTNYVMLECGKPIHAFDLDKVAGRKLIVKRATNGEKFTTLDGKEHLLDDSMTMVHDAERSSGVAGVMGGQISEISDETVNVCIESAIWKPSAIRRTAKKLGITSDAAYRFERGVDMETVVYAADRAAQLIAEIAGGAIASAGIDLYPTVQPTKTATVRYARAEKLIGKEIQAPEQRSLLQRLGCTIDSIDLVAMRVRIPSYRVDIDNETDLIEEIARLYGYDNIEPQMNSHVNFDAQRTPEALAPLPFTKEIAALLRSNGFHEIMTQNMIDPKSAAFFTDNPVRLQNPLGEELSCMRPSLVPSVLKVIERNHRFGQKNLRLFETGTVFSHTSFSHIPPTEETFVRGFREQQQLIVALTGSTATNKHWSASERMVDFYDIKGMLESLAASIGIKNATLKPASAPQPLFSANCIELNDGNSVIAFAGEIAPTALKAFGVETHVFVCVLNLWMLPHVAVKRRTYHAVSPYPAVARDLAFVVDASVEAETVRALIAAEAGEYLRGVRVFDVFKNDALGANKKSLAFALTYNSHEKTLADADVDASIQRIVKVAQERVGAALRQ